MNDEAARTRSDFSHVERITELREIPAPSRVWTDADWQEIRRGHAARDMDDKWNAFVDGDRLFLHRSWTGVGDFEAEFAKSAAGWRIAHAFVNAEARQDDHDDTADTLFLELLVESVLLSRFHVEAWRRFWDMIRRDDASDDMFGLMLHVYVGNYPGRPVPPTED
jgi:hypothetical protein